MLSSAIVTFASGISAFSAPNLIGGGYKVLSTQIVRSKANNHMEMASVQVIVLFLISLAGNDIEDKAQSEVHRFRREKDGAVCFRL